MNTFEELEAWKQARQLRKDISLLTKKFPADEKYRLTDQLLRATRSVTANISEGFGRFHYQENIQYCRQARGSLNETIEHLICAFDEGFIDEPCLKQHKEKAYHCLKILNGYILYLKNAKSSSP